MILHLKHDQIFVFILKAECILLWLICRCWYCVRFHHWFVVNRCCLHIVDIRLTYI